MEQRWLDTGRGARDARREIEAALEAQAWPWSARLSRWIDGLITIEECSAHDDEMTS